MKRKDNARTCRILCISMWIPCVIALVLTLYFLGHTYRIKHEFIQVSATVEEVFENSTRVSYATESREVTSTIHEIHSDWQIGSNVTVYYDPKYPSDVTTLFSGILVSILSGSAFLLFLILGLVFYKSGYGAIRKRKQLMANGKVIQAWITGIDYDTGVIVNGVNPIRFNCADEKNHEYKSESVLDLDERILGQNVLVYIDRKNPSSYYVDDQELKERMKNNATASM